MIHRICEGRVSAAVFQALFVLVLSAICFPFFLWGGLLLFLISMHLFAVQSGLRLDFTKRRFQKFKQVYSLIWGNWHRLPAFSSAELLLSSSNTQYVGGNLMYGFGNASSFYGGRSTKSLTYDIVLVSESGNRFTLFEFMKYKDAVSCLKLFSSEGTPVTDHVAEKIAQNQQRRRRF